ncbi:hypothetical protein E4O05_00665 [Treponema sp. OMZ 787]|uniref:hypothetical protein n=1 Tax=Treponema sp. OMZ 787 TaxID=2563669 RepID=UPI0020A3A761|nr:hypothetical protein [Treponema sp. OMZ 787]UTC62460.1 hypothetical protein E4O05_00665 [Treponema sp. OMZ 787]
MNTSKKIIRLTDEALLMVRGGFDSDISDETDKKNIDENPLKGNNRRVYEITENNINAAIYQRGARSNYDYNGLNENSTSCNQHSFDVGHSTGFHMDGFYGNQSLQKKGRMRGYDVNATAAYDNIVSYVKEYPKKYLEMHINNDIPMDIGNDFSRTEHGSRLDKGAEYADKCKALLKFGEDVCPIKIIEDGEQAQRLVNEKEFTVFALWRNPEAKKGLSSHIAVVVEDKNPYDPAKGPLMGNVGWNNGIIYQNERAFGKTYKYKYEKTADGKPKSIDKKIIYVYDVTQTGKPDTQADGFCGIAHDFATGKQSISIHDPNYDENDYMNYKKRKVEEDKYLGKLKEEISEEYLKQHPGLYNSESKNFNFDNPFFTYELTKYALGKTAFSVLIDTRADDLRKVLRNNNMTLLSAIKKGDKNVDNVLLGRITAGDYIEQKKAEIAAQEKARAEAEAKRIAEVKRIAQAKAKAEAEVKRIAEEKAAREKAERERLEKERLKQEEENRKREDKIANPSPGPAPDTDPNDTDNDTNDNDRDDKKDKDPEPWINKPDTTKKENDKNTGGGNKTPPKSGNDENPPPPKNNPPPKKGGGDSGISKPKPPAPPGGGGSGVIYTPSSTDTGNEYYLDTLYGAKPFSAQESSAFNSTIISNELSALQPVSSLNVAGLPVNDVAIRKEPFGV